MLLWAVRARERKIGDETAEHVRITWQREVIDARVVRQAEMEARHSLPREDRVVRDVLLVDVAVAREEHRRGVYDLPNRQVGKSRPDDGIDPRTLLGVDVNVGEGRRVAYLQEPDVMVRDFLCPRQARVREQTVEVLRRVATAGGRILDDD